MRTNLFLDMTAERLFGKMYLYELREKIQLLQPWIS
jgi:hypothetical protein